MPLLKGQGFKSSPVKALNYIMDQKKAAYISSYGLDDDRSYAVQFKETAEMYAKGEKFRERKYYHFKHSFDPKDQVSPEEAHAMTQELVEQAFEQYECVMATHIDKAHIHSHFIVNAISFMDGRKLHINNQQYAALKDLSNEISLSYGYSALDFRSAGKEKITQAEHHIKQKGELCWKDEIREVIRDVQNNVANFEDFVQHVQSLGFQIKQAPDKPICFIHTKMDRVVRGRRLGSKYTKEGILTNINEVEE